MKLDSTSMRRSPLRRALLGALRCFRGPFWPVSSEPACGTLECAACGSRPVCPMDWGTHGDHHWWIRSRCGHCGVWCEVVASNAQAACLERELDRQAAEIRRAADRLEAERMLREAEAFIAALHRDLIVAADFA